MSEQGEFVEDAARSAESARINEELSGTQAALQFWRSSLERFASEQTTLDLRSAFGDWAPVEIEHHLRSGRSPDFLDSWKRTFLALVQALPAADRAIARNRVVLAQARAEAMSGIRFERRRELGIGLT
ncbi:hypothetical protein [Pseudoxanthomonas sp. GM95]|uniref:hypothetical protein n=1 Tax=Pseudoxanthomonas sp. GM95 TaxID=1881043 RepID=UPI000B89C5B3|nr:hypothetical protein [Pseudoxanthomonas sp. GM95]